MLSALLVALNQAYVPTESLANTCVYRPLDSHIDSE